MNQLIETIARSFFFFFFLINSISLISLIRKEIQIGYISMNLVHDNRGSIIHPNDTIVHPFGMLSQKMSCNVAISTDMGCLPRVKQTLSHPYSFNDLLDGAWTWNLPLQSTHHHLRTSLSSITSLSPRSHASWTPSSTALASVSSAPHGHSNLLLIAPISCPHSFLITTPTPQPLTSLNIAPSTLIL